jgi:hypothetical protein
MLAEPSYAEEQERLRRRYAAVRGLPDGASWDAIEEFDTNFRRQHKGVLRVDFVGSAGGLADGVANGGTPSGRGWAGVIEAGMELRSIRRAPDAADADIPGRGSVSPVEVRDPGGASHAPWTRRPRRRAKSGDGSLLGSQQQAAGIGRLGSELLSGIVSWTRSGLSLQEDMALALGTAHTDTDSILMY